jgi:signal transduction histidine kinase
VSRVGQSRKSESSDHGDELTTRRMNRWMSPPSGEEWVEIAFQDTGRGIPPEELNRIFDPFFTTRPSGTGLGLAIAHKILESMGGHIDVTSRPNFGTTFFLWLRRAPVAVGAGSRR